MIPSFISDTAKATDTYARQGGKGVTGIMAKTPFVNQMLPAKVTIFGEKIENEGALSTILFGSRVKTNRENDIIREISSVSNNIDKGINFTDWDKSSSKTIVQFKEKVGEKQFNDAKIKYGRELKTQLGNTFTKLAYKKLSDEEKYKVIINKDTDAMDKIFKQYGFK